jgi:hypothetical protein
MHPIFAHAAALISLCLVEVAGSAIFDLLHTHAGALPRLTEFKLMLLDQMEDDVDDKATRAICEFISGRSTLRRFDVDTPGMNIDLVLSVLPELQQLTALGCDARSSSSDEEVEMLARAIPPGLVALHMQHPWEGMNLGSYEIQPLVSFLRGTSFSWEWKGLDPERGRKRVWRLRDELVN